MVDIIKRPSPNFTPQKKDREISIIVIHATAGQMPGCLLWMINKLAKVSSHYLIDRDGVVFQLVDEKDIAWHAGKSFWGKKPHVNFRSIGIELENDNVGQEYPLVQVDSLLDLTANLVLKYNIAMNNVVRHADISPGRKTDPWKFPWKEFIMNLANLVIWRGVKEASWQVTTTNGDNRSCWEKIKSKLRRK